MSRLTIAASIVALAAALGAAHPAAACHPPKCAGSYPLPRTTVPANGSHLVIYPRVDRGMPPATLDVELRKSGASEAVPVTVSSMRKDGSFLITPGQELEPGASYELRVADNCEGTGKADSSAVLHKLTVTAKAALPTELGTIIVDQFDRGQLTVATVSGMCDTTIAAAWARARLSLHPEAKPWASMFRYELLVNGKPWRFHENLAWDVDPRAFASERVYTICKSADPGALAGLPEGQSTLQFRATIPGTSLSLISKPITMSLFCAGVPTDDLPGPDGGVGSWDFGSCGDASVAPQDPMAARGCSLGGAPSAGGAACCVVLLGLALLRLFRSRS